MSAVTTEKLHDVKFLYGGQTLLVPVASGETIYGGSFGMIDKNGYLVNLTSSNYHQARVICYIADKNEALTCLPAATTSAGSISGSFQQGSAIAGDKTVREVFIDPVVEVNFVSIDQADLFKTVYLQNNNDADQLHSGGIKMGTLVTYISSTKGYVKLNTFHNADGWISLRVPLTAATTTAGGDALNLLNPAGETIMIKNLIVDITTKSTGAATIDCGIGTTGLSNDTLIDGLDVGSAAIIGTALTDGGTNGRAFRKMTSAQYLTITPSATLAGMVGTVEIEFKIWE